MQKDRQVLNYLIKLFNFWSNVFSTDCCHTVIVLGTRNFVGLSIKALLKNYTVSNYINNYNRFVSSLYLCYIWKSTHWL